MTRLNILLSKLDSPLWLSIMAFTSDISGVADNMFQTLWPAVTYASLKIFDGIVMPKLKEYFNLKKTIENEK